MTELRNYLEILHPNDYYWLVGGILSLLTLLSYVGFSRDHLSTINRLLKAAVTQMKEERGKWKESVRIWEEMATTHQAENEKLRRETGGRRTPIVVYLEKQVRDLTMQLANSKGDEDRDIFRHDLVGGWRGDWCSREEVANIASLARKDERRAFQQTLSKVVAERNKYIRDLDTSLFDLKEMKLKYDQCVAENSYFERKGLQKILRFPGDQLFDKNHHPVGEIEFVLNDGVIEEVIYFSKNGKRIN